MGSTSGLAVGIGVISEGILDDARERREWKRKVESALLTKGIEDTALEIVGPGEKPDLVVGGYGMKRVTPEQSILRQIEGIKRTQDVLSQQGLGEEYAAEPSTKGKTGITRRSGDRGKEKSSHDMALFKQAKEDVKDAGLSYEDSDLTDEGEARTQYQAAVQKRYEELQAQFGYGGEGKPLAGVGPKDGAGGAGTSQFQEGQIYEDAKGRRAKYQGGKFVPAS